MVTFQTGDNFETIAGRLLESGWLQARLSVVRCPSSSSPFSGSPSSLVLPPATDWAAFAPYTAREMTWRHCDVFEKAAAIVRSPVVRGPTHRPPTSYHRPPSSAFCL